MNKRFPMYTIAIWKNSTVVGHVYHTVRSYFLRKEAKLLVSSIVTLYIEHTQLRYSEKTLLSHNRALQVQHT